MLGVNCPGAALAALTIHWRSNGNSWHSVLKTEGSEATEVRRDVEGSGRACW